MPTLSLNQFIDADQKLLGLKPKPIYLLLVPCKPFDRRSLSTLTISALLLVDQLINWMTSYCCRPVGCVIFDVILTARIVVAYHQPFRVVASQINLISIDGNPAVTFKVISVLNLFYILYYAPFGYGRIQNILLG